MELRNPYALFLGDAPDQLAAKVAIGVAEWRPEQCVGQVRLPDCKPRLDLRDMSLDEAAEAGAQTLVIGVANRGGLIPDSWHQTLVDAVILGLDIASGLYTPLSVVVGRKNSIGAANQPAGTHETTRRERVWAEMFG